MKDIIEKYTKEIEEISITTAQHLEEFRLKYLSKKGSISDLFEQFKTLEGDAKREIGKTLNELKNKAQNKFNELKDILELASDSATKSDVDLTIPAEPNPLGSRHPLS